MLKLFKQVTPQVMFQRPITNALKVCHRVVGTGAEFELLSKMLQENPDMRIKDTEVDT